ncbi:MAG: PLP-dependent aminotransferase family protein, partial [Clostridia bacterium]|nr:PLP-dependent aminotransferase family protein [Clostridia bacterium]
MKDYPISDFLAGMKPSAIREIFKSLSDPKIISFSGGNPDPQSFPARDMAKIAQDLFENHAAQALQYGISEGYEPLRKAVTERVERVFHIHTPGDETLIVTGGTQGIELTCRTLCNPGDTVIAENPSFIGALNSFRVCGCRIRGVTLRDDGMDLDELEAVLKSDPRVRMIYTIPTFQNPTGRTSSKENREAVLKLATRYNVMILEDNPYGELRFAGEDVPTIKSMDHDGQVIYCSSFSKILSSGMRIGYLIGPEPVMQKLIIGKQCEDVHTNLFFQMLTSEYMNHYPLDKHIREIQAIYRKKAFLMISELEKDLPGCVSFTRP